MRTIQLLLCICFASQFTGACTAKPPPTVLYACPEMYDHNPIHSVAVWVETEVRFPRWEGKGAIGYSASRNAAERAAPMIAAVLQNKGYQVPYARPAAVSYPAPVPYHGDMSDRWVVDTHNDGAANTVSQREAVHVFTASFDSPETAQCVQHVLENEKLTFHGQRYRKEGISPEIAAFLGQKTGADTLCRLFLFGNTTTGGRKALNVFLNAAPYTSARDDDITNARITCWSAKTGTPVFADESVTYSNPTLPVPPVFETLLHELPKAGHPMNPEVVLSPLMPPGGPPMLDPFPTVPLPAAAMH